MGNWCCHSRVGASNKKIFLLMVGLDNAGKTCTAKSIVGESLETVAPTVGFSKVDHKYKGYQVTIYDLGGSKNFRGIWPKYYHEVHGFVFVVDSSASERSAECSSVLGAMLQHEKVKGKPLLVLCNKADLEQSQDEVEVVSMLDIESLVNAAQCPTRVEASVAVKNQGLKEGYKWLVKSVIANYLELGDRVERDVEEELIKEEARRAQVRKRLEERRRLEAQDDEDNEVSLDPPGFVPVANHSHKWMKPEVPNGGASHSNLEEININEGTTLSNGGTTLINGGTNHLNGGAILSNGGFNQLNGGHSVTNGIFKRSNSIHELNINNLNQKNGVLPELHGRGRLELEPMEKKKKKGLLSKLNNRNSVTDVQSLTSQISGDESPKNVGAHKGERNWGLAEELQPSG